jgi:hypothetical protein
MEMILFLLHLVVQNRLMEIYCFLLLCLQELHLFPVVVLHPHRLLFLLPLREQLLGVQVVRELLIVQVLRGLLELQRGLQGLRVLLARMEVQVLRGRLVMGLREVQEVQEQE